jgi:3-hydroxyisobutyrate dehydrogenase-like beta-hydroxyacid dehydrogenase
MTNTGENAKPRLGFIGLGHMGRQMVQRLIDAGYQMTVYDRTREIAQEVAQKGAKVVATPRELAASCDVILSSVTNDAALEEVMYGPDGVLAGTKPGNILIEMSTVSPNTSRRLFEEARNRGVSMIDASVSGSVPQVEQGSLVIFVGGEEEIYQRCKPILNVLGHEIFYIGPSGMGNTMKLVVNTLLGLGLQALAEAIALGEKAGIDRGLLLDVLGKTAVVSPSQKSKLENVRRDEYPVNFALSLMYKDFGLVLNEASELSVPMPSTAAAQQMYAAAQVKEGDQDFGVLVRFMQELAGIYSRKL